MAATKVQQATSKIDAAKKMAKIHFAVEPDMKHIFLLEPIREDDPREPIKLLEVVKGAIERGIEPVYFPSDAARGVPYPTVIVELSPREFRSIDPTRIQFRDELWHLGEELGPKAAKRRRSA